MADPARFSVAYRITATTSAEAEKLGNRICVEQATGMSGDTLSQEVMANWAGRVTGITQLSDSLYKLDVSFPLSTAGGEINQWLNLIYVNNSMRKDALLTYLDWEAVTGLLRGPRFGVAGIRKLAGIPERTMSSVTLKPAGLNFAELADLAHRFARGGVDIISEDPGLSNQVPAPFLERVKAVVDAVQKASDKTGKKTVYFPNVTADGIDTWRRYEIAADLGADGVLVAPHLTGLSVLKALSESEPPLPVMAHPAFSGNCVSDEARGFSPSFYYGALWRALGADTVIYPALKDGFPLNESVCSDIHRSLVSDRYPFRPSLPLPGSGVELENIKMWVESNGSDTICPMGDSLYQHPNGVEIAIREFQNQIEEFG